LIGDGFAGVVGSDRFSAYNSRADQSADAAAARVGLDREAATRRARARENLLKLWPALWTFADVDDVDPADNAAERGLRAAVIYRKLSLGSRSQGGERTVERLLSVDQTRRLRRRSL
jgi:transposase